MMDGTLAMLAFLVVALLFPPAKHGKGKVSQSSLADASLKPVQPQVHKATSAPRQPDG